MHILFGKKDEEIRCANLQSNKVTKWEDYSTFQTLSRTPAYFDNVYLSDVKNNLFTHGL